MSDKYCLTGKIECERYIENYRRYYTPIRFCQCTDSIPAHQVMINYFEFCPWPSRQLPVEKTIGYPGPDDDPLVQAYKQGYDRGRSDALKEAVGKLKSLRVWNAPADTTTIILYEAIAAIESLAKGG